MDKRYCIFDMDGTLTDSMGLWQNLGREYLLSKGVEPDGQLRWMIKAMTMTESAAYFMEAYSISGPPAKIVREMEEMMDAHYRRDVPLKPGVREYLLAKKAQGVHLSVATATAEPLARSCFRRLGVEDLFECIVSCETLGVSKERPDVFLLAAERMGASPADCAVFEDTLYAARTAHQAGFYTVGIFEASYSSDWESLKALCDEAIEDWETTLSPSRRLHESVGDIWSGYHHHPFVTGIGDGTLPEEKFRFFLLQDYLYLLEYAKVFALGVVKAKEPALMRLFAANLHEILDGEMEIHHAYMARLGITSTDVEHAKKALANDSYTAYMLSVAFTGGPREIVASILACSWSYAEIGGALAAARPEAIHHPLYGAWIAGYTSEEYTATNAQLIALMDALAADCNEAEFRQLEEIFITCSRYEAGFWDMAWNGAD